MAKKKLNKFKIRILNKISLINFFLIIICALAVNYNYVYAQGKISGVVTDKSTGEAIPGVNVLLVNQSIGAATDINGNYFILNIPPGTYSLKASNIGYRSITKTNVVVSTNHTTEIDFQMEATVVEIGEDIVVTAERPLIEKDQTSTRHFVSSEDISTRPTTQLTEILNTLPGIDADATGALTVRRGTIDQVAFLIDGIRASNPLDYTPYTNINLSSIQELEIITGGFNAEYGQAQSGVFNIITKEGSKNLSGYAEFRWVPAHKPHWGTAFYDYSTDKYWENTHARHLQWWIDHPDQWVDPKGISGNDPASEWTPEEAYNNYIKNHQPLNDYTEENGFQEEFSLGGPLPVENMFFFFSGKYRTAPPVTGNSFRSIGKWIDGTAKITYRIGSALKFMLSGFYSKQETNQGMEYLDNDWVTAFGLANKYAYYDFPGYPESSIQGQTLQLTHVLGKSTFYTLQLSRVYRERSTSVFPNDPTGWETGVPEYDRLRAKDSFGNPIPGGFNNLIGLHTTGYYYRGNDKNTDLTFAGDFTSQLSQNMQLKFGIDFNYYILDRYQEAKAYTIIEDQTYNPYEGAFYAQTKLEFEGLIMNLGLRYDFYNSNDKIFLNPFDPFGFYEASLTGNTPVSETSPTKTYSQFSPRIGISHPISENTVLHFSYGHFFQRANFGDYGEGQEVNGILNTYIVDPASGQPVAYNLGNRNLEPRKTVQYELGIEHNINGLVADITAYYKDITKTVRTITVITKSGNRYLSSGNGDYGDAKGVEISLRKPLTKIWGGYLNYTWSTGIFGRSGDPTILVPPNSDIQVTQPIDIGDFIQYDRPRLKFGFTLATPSDFSPLFGIFSNMQFSLDYQIYYPHDKIASDVFSEAGQQYIKNSDKNADIRIRKEIDFGSIHPAFFIEIRNAFNNKWVNLDIVKSASPEDRVKFINSGFTNFPETKQNGAPFPDVLKYRNLPRQVTFGVSVGF